MNMSILELKKKAVDVRIDIMEMVSKGKSSAHPAPAMSCADILTALYFGIMDVRTDDPHWPDRDRFILSKGHACPVIYSVLEQKGFYPREEIYSLRGIDSILQGHPDMKKTPGIDMTSGSLGNGLSAGVGMALGLKLQQKKSNVFVVIGDGESQEGMVWEAAMTAAKYKLDNLIAFLDYNHIQSSGYMEPIMPIEPVTSKWESFGFRVFQVNGHSMEDLISVIEMAKQVKNMPVMIVAHTTKGQGVSYMENNPAWHSKLPTQAEYEQAIAELKAKKEALEAQGN